MTTYFEKPDFEYNPINIFDEYDWLKYVIQTIFFCFLKLHSEKLIEFNYLENEHIILAGLYTYRTSRIKVILTGKSRDIDIIDDKLTKEIFASLIYLSRQYNNKTDLKIISDFLINRLIEIHWERSKKQFYRPEKKFIFQCLKMYANFSWFKHLKQKKLVGLYNVHHFKMDKNLQSLLTNEYKDFIDHYHKEENNDALIFKNHLEKIIHAEFKSRIPSND